jgi:hypothetical protein
MNLTAAPIFHVYRGTSPIAEISIDDSMSLAPISVSETQQLGFELSGREPETEYRIRLGNVEQASAPNAWTASSVVSTGRVYNRLVHWEEGAYLESGRGRTTLFLESRIADEAKAWRPRAIVQFVVLPTKLGELRYQRMLDELTGLAAGFVLDLISKSKISLGFASTAGGILAGSSQLELRTLHATWRRITAALELIQREPATAIARRQVLRQCWGSERLGYRAVRQLATSGADLRDKRSPRPFVTRVETTQETVDTVEHRRIVAFLQLLEDRVRECAVNAERQMRIIERDREFRESRRHDEESLYEAVDLPRIRRLRDAADSAYRLRSNIRDARSLEFLRGVRPSPGPLQGPVFEHIVPYRRFREAAIAFARSSVVVLGDDGEDQLKSTSRMYEQWVFLQILAAIRNSGLRAEIRSSLIRALGRQRFTLDIERGTHVEFRSRDKRIVSVRYEPWILPNGVARARRDTVYRGREGTTPWSPDILIEVMRDDAEEGVPNTVEYGIVVDAKYSRRLGDRHWDAVRKYLDIKSTRTGREVVYQVWLAYPGDEDHISLHDSDIVWNPEGPDLPFGDHALGTLPLAPDLTNAVAEAGDIRPTERAREFVRGLLAYLRFPEAVPPTSEPTTAHLRQ